MDADESMTKPEELLCQAMVQVIAREGHGRPRTDVPSIQSGADPDGLVATVWPDGARHPLVVAVPGSRGGYPFAIVGHAVGISCRVRLALFLDDGAEMHCRKTSSFDRNLWDKLARCAVRHLKTRRPEGCKVISMNGCMFHASAVGLRLFKDARVVVLRFPYCLYHAQQALGGQNSDKTMPRSTTVPRAMLPTLSWGFKVSISSLMK